MVKEMKKDLAACLKVVKAHWKIVEGSLEQIETNIGRLKQEVEDLQNLEKKALEIACWEIANFEA